MNKPIEAIYSQPFSKGNYVIYEKDGALIADPVIFNPDDGRFFIDAAMIPDGELAIAKMDINGNIAVGHYDDRKIGYFRSDTII